MPATETAPPDTKKPDKKKGSLLAEEIPSPFRPSHLLAMIKEHAAEAGVPVSAIDPHRFLKEHALPSPLNRYRVTGSRFDKDKNKIVFPPEEFDCVDESEARRLYVNKCEVKAEHVHTCQIHVAKLVE